MVSRTVIELSSWEFSLPLYRVKWPISYFLDPFFLFLHSLLCFTGAHYLEELKVKRLGLLRILLILLSFLVLDSLTRSRTLLEISSQNLFFLIN